MAAAGVLVTAIRVLAVVAAPARHTRALIRPGIISCNKNAAQYFHVSATHTHETNGTKAQAAAQSAPLPLSLATRASQSATTSAYSEPLPFPAQYVVGGSFDASPSAVPQGVAVAP